MKPANPIIPVFLASLFFSCDSSAQSVSQQLDQIRYETEQKISDYTNPRSAPVILPQIIIRSDPYKVPLRPFPASPIAPQYILDPNTGMFEQIR